MDPITIDQIYKFLPHRFPFLLVDRVISFDAETNKLVAIKNVTINEPFFTGHFPQSPVMPGVLMIEALAQAAGVLTYKITESFPSPDNWYYLAGLDNARFKRIVKPGDQLRLEIELLRRRTVIWKYKGIAYVGDEVACSVEIMSARGQLSDQ